MSRFYPSGWLGQLAGVVVGAVVLGLVTGLAYVALTSRTPDRQTALPDQGRGTASPTASPSASASATPTTSTTATPAPTATPGTATATATATAVPTGAATGAATTAPTSGSTASGAAPTPVGVASKLPTTVRPPRTAYAVAHRLFGVHDGNPIGAHWPNAPVRSIRVWDAGATWRDIETSPGEFDFSVLDSIVTTAQANGADVLLVLGQTPTFHAVNPRAASFYGEGASSMPKMAAWKRYVARVAERYRGQPVRFQVWNEANVIGFWSGTPAQMAQLTKATYDVLNAVNPDATLVAPAFVTRLSSQRTWLDKFYAQRVAGRPVAAWVDVVSLQLYPVATGTPEDSINLLAVNRGILARHGVRKPIWNTEVNYGMTGQPVTALPSRVQAGYVARTYLLNAANGVRRVYWYGWETQSLVTTRMVTSDGQTLTAAGVAFRVVAEWMRGARIDNCPVNRAGTYTCTLTKNGETRRVYWNPRRTVSVVTASDASAAFKLDGTKQTIKGGTTLRVGSVPVMVS